MELGRILIEYRVFGAEWWLELPSYPPTPSDHIGPISLSLSDSTKLVQPWSGKKIGKRLPQGRILLNLVFQQREEYKSRQFGPHFTSTVAIRHQSLNTQSSSADHFPLVHPLKMFFNSATEWMGVFSVCRLFGRHLNGIRAAIIGLILGDHEISKNCIFYCNS